MKPRLTTIAMLLSALALIVACDNGGVSLPPGPLIYEPSGATPWVTGTTRDVTWWVDASVPQVLIELHDTNTGGAPVLTISASTDGAAGTYSWPVSAPAPGIYYVRVSDPATRLFYSRRLRESRIAEAPTSGLTRGEAGALRSPRSTLLAGSDVAG